MSAPSPAERVLTLTARRTAMPGKADVYTRVTSKILADLERGNLTWLQPWQAGHQAGPVSRPLRAGGQPYRGINVLMLWAAAMERNYCCPLWLTYRQAGELGGQVRKGEKGSLVVYANEIVRTDTDESGADVEIKIPFMKGYTVFNGEQIDGLPSHFYAIQPPLANPGARLEFAERFFANTKIDIHHGGNRAFYSVDRDLVQMPEFQTFRDGESYYATLAHECCHATRHPARLNRDLGRKKYADAGYAMEELVAEIGAAFLCCDLGITPESREDHAAYLQCWLTVLKNDTRAAGQAQKAADFLKSLQPQTAEPSAQLAA
jgi:antirestriction protein ArdC